MRAVAGLLLVVLPVFSGCSLSHEHATASATHPPYTPVAELVPAHGRLELDVLDARVVQLGETAISLGLFEEFVTSDAQPLANRPVVLFKDADVSYRELVDVVDVIVQGGCTDISFGPRSP